jgi:hypothetical protein
MLVAAALSMDLADLARGVRNVAVNTQDTRLARGGQATEWRLQRIIAPLAWVLTPVNMLNAGGLAPIWWLSHAAQVHKYRLDSKGGHIGAQEYIQPRATGGFFVNPLGDLQVSSPFRPRCCPSLK